MTEENKQKDKDSENISQNKTQHNLAPMKDFLALFEESLEFFTHNFKKLISLLSVPILAYLVIFAIIFLFSLLSSKNNFKTSSFLFIFLVISIILGFILAIIAKIGLYLYVKDVSKNISLLEVLKKAKSKFLGFIWVGFLINLFVIFWSFLFIIPGIIFSLYYSLSYWVYIYEHKTGINALRGSKDLIKSYWWAVLKRYFFLYGMFFLFFFGSTWIIDFLFNNSIIKLAWSVVIQVIAFLSVPLFIIFSNFIYLDLKRIKKQ